MVPRITNFTAASGETSIAGPSTTVLFRSEVVQRRLPERADQLTDRSEGPHVARAGHSPTKERQGLNGTMCSVSNLITGDRSATRNEVLAARKILRQLAERQGLSDPRVDALGTVIVHSDEPGYAPLMRYADAAAKAVGAWVNVITDDAAAAQVSAEAL
jgi:hypothetical protein